MKTHRLWVLVLSSLVFVTGIVMAGAIGGVGLFMLGWWFGLYSVGTAEVLAAWPIVIYAIGTNK